MDKNTLIGLLLMGLVMFGFMWMSKPKAPEAAADTPAIEHSGDATTATPRVDVPSEAAVAAAVRTVGTRDLDGVHTFTDGHLTVCADSLGKVTGTYQAAADAPATDIAPLLAGDGTGLTATETEALKAITTLAANSARYQGFAKYMGGEERLITLENDLAKFTFSTKGGIVSQVELKNYKTELTDSATNILMMHGAGGYNFTFNTADQRINTSAFNFDGRVEGDSCVVMSMSPAPGAVWAIRYTIAPDAYTVRMDIEQTGMTAVMPPSTTVIDFDWQQKLARNELGRTFEERNSAVYYKYLGEGVDDLSSTSDARKDLNGRLRWIAFKNQFFSSVIIPRDCFSSATVSSVVLKDPDYLKDMRMSATVPYTIADGRVASFDFYFGPNDYPILSHLDDTLGYDDEGLSLTRLIPLGWGIFRWINTLIIIPVFTFLGSFINNYGIIILLLTIFIKLILFPFTFKSFKSQAKMRLLAPEIKEINEKYPGDENAMKRQQETMALYSRAGASPFSGCLPMLLQMPVLIAMFSFFPSAIELRGQSFLWAHDLSAPDYILTLPFTIPFYGDRVSLFCLLMTIINIVYMKISMQSQPTGSSMPGMKLMQYIMPVMFLFIFNDYASGLSYYYLLSLLITIIQTYIFRHVIDEKKVREQMLANARKPRKKSGFMARLEEAQRQAQAAQRQQQQQANKRRK